MVDTHDDPRLYSLDAFILSFFIYFFCSFHSLPLSLSLSLSLSPSLSTCVCACADSPLYAQAQLYEAQAHHLFGLACSKLAYEVNHFSHRQQLQTAALAALDHAATIDADNADVIFHLALVHADVRKVYTQHTFMAFPHLMCGVGEEEIKLCFFVVLFGSLFLVSVCLILG